MANENEREDLLRLPEQESSSDGIIDDNEYRKSLCLPIKRPTGDAHRLSLQRSHSYDVPLNNLNSESTEESQQKDVAASVNYVKKTTKVSTENDEYSEKCTELRKDQNLEYVKHKTPDNGEGKIQLVDIPKQQPSQNQNPFYKYKRIHPEENTLEEFSKKQCNDKQVEEDESLLNNDFIPEALEQDEFKPCEPKYEIQQLQIDENELKKVKYTEEKLPNDSVDSGDVIKMNGLFCLLVYFHYVLVVSKSDDGIKVIEYSTRLMSKPLLIFKTLIMMLAFLDPIAMLAQAKTTIYTFQQLKDRNARKIIFPKELNKYKEQFLQNQRKKERTKEPDYLYSLRMNNCEHLVHWTLFGTSVSFQLDTRYMYLHIMDGIYSGTTAIHLIAVAGLITGYLGISWVHVCFIHELYLALYQSQKVYRQKKLSYISHTKSEEEMCSIWTMAIIYLVVALLAGWLTGTNESCFSWCCTLVIVLGNLMGLVILQKFLIIDLKLRKTVLTWSLMAVGVCYVSYLSVLWNIAVPLFGWLIKSIVVCMTLKGICVIFE